MKSILFFAAMIIMACSCGLSAQTPAPAAFPAVYATNVSVGDISVVACSDETHVILSPSCQWVQVYVPGEGTSMDIVLSEPANVYYLDTETVIAVSWFNELWSASVNTKTGDIAVSWKNLSLTGCNPMHSITSK